MACEELYENCKVSIEHSLSNGLYCEVHADRKLNEKDREKIKLKMQEIIDADYKIEKTIVTKMLSLSIGTTMLAGPICSAL